MGSFAEAFEQAYQDENVKKFTASWNTWRDTKSNLFSQSTQDFFRDNQLIPDTVKDKYFAAVATANGLTGGLASSNVVTKGLRYQKVINKGIDIGLDMSEKVAGKMNAAEDKINNAIDNKLQELHEERIEREEARKSRELPNIKTPSKDDEAEYYPGSKAFRFM